MNEELDRMKTCHFWSHDFFKSDKKRKFYSIIRTYTNLQNFFWLCVPFILVIVNGSFVHLKFLFNTEWPIVFKVIYNLNWFTITFTGYLVGSAHVSYYVYNMLHHYLQIVVLAEYLQQEFKRVNQMLVKREIYPGAYQKIMKEVLIQCIKQHELLIR